MQDLKEHNVRRNIGDGDEIGVLQSLSLLELVAVGNAKSRILKNINVLVAHGHFISQIRGRGEMFFRAISENA